MGLFTKNFGQIEYGLDVPHLLKLQLDSYMNFLQEEADPMNRQDQGLEAVFRSVFPIEDFNKSATLEYVSYEINQPKYDVAECLSKGLTYEAPIRIKVRLIVYDVDDESGNRTVRDIKEQDIYFGTLPLMTEKGTFIINGTERIIVNQLQRSPGIIFEHDSGKTHTSRKVLYSSRIIPMRGSWLDFEFDPKDILYVRIDRRRKMYVTILLKALGMSEEDILNYFYDREQLKFKDQKVYRKVRSSHFRKEIAYKDILDSEGNVLVRAGRPVTKRVWRQMAKAKEHMEIDPGILPKQFVAHDLVHPETGEVLAEVGDALEQDVVDKIFASGIEDVEILYTGGQDVSSSLRDTLKLDKTQDQLEAQVEIYKRLRPSSPPTPEIASSFFDNLFRNSDYYDLSPVGRYKLNARLGLNLPTDYRTLSNEDILRVVKHLIKLKDSHGPADDIDHLGNRRVRPVGELVENQYRIGLVRMERAVKERMSLQEVATLMPHDLINPKPVTAVLKEFFGTSQLSQFMDQTNPLSEVTHKRRLSALGPGGLTRERAGFEVRDVHPSHYGRICPIETPEGPNIGLIVSLTTHAQVNDFGFIETPYRIVKDGMVTNEVKYLDASKEADEVIAQANAPVDEEGRFTSELITSRIHGELNLMPRDEVTLMDVSPTQIVSISSALIPFLEHDDANRALMGSNMQRQAVPLLKPERPLVGTGMEGLVARDSGSCEIARADGIVRYVDANKVIVSYDEPPDKSSQDTVCYDLQKYHKSNQNSCFGQRPRVLPDQRFKAGDVLADGPSIVDGELALGKNLSVAFMPWCGYNFEDSILISERMVKDDVFSSVHIEEFEVIARDTKLGPEEITRDIPNVGEDMLKYLDDSGIIMIGAKIQQDDILVGKITPKGETQLTPEERLLRAIFGDKARDVKNTSLKVPPGIEGTVIDIKVFNRRSGEKDERTRIIEDRELDRLAQSEEKHVQGLTAQTRDRIWEVVSGKRLAQTIMGRKKGQVLAEANSTLQREDLDRIPLKKLAGSFASKEVNEAIEHLIKLYEEQLKFIQNVYSQKRDKVVEGDDLPPGVTKMVKVYVAVKRKLNVGDKMAGRHGNKGVVSCILPEEDMPFFDDGTPIDIVLSPLGVPSRMNIGQIMETHLGWAARELGRQLGRMLEQGVDVGVLRKEVDDIFNSPEISRLAAEMDDESFVRAVRELEPGILTKTPVFDGAKEEEIWPWLKKAGLSDDGKAVLYDGRTGDAFHNRITVGNMYMLKLHHLVDEKIHARSTGPYSLVTQQPLGGKAQFGGQRLGEMEVWAIEAYGASYLLQEFLTVKSDDVAGRVNMYEKIVKGNNFLESAMPESFNVLIKELMALGLDVDLLLDEKKKSRK
ncbi:DNA-directed RNA polymerase, beta subunit [Desulfonatronospira thiodismutans ASO3-1]|uniref:DNA-directed RNA polymerase subunit beta n=1 Tax=Desulfonatronospira thiodismutans ASO3-1 TaxID=555779 RepID=D6SUP0_9BACT|nr:MULTISPECIES: DNA-directed RNA polymerase subunit beta [Desulfonatronospira]EFI33020.1 DNA-directed RNA polymerase, beta subunit [Desulfonatronospira thiodismutans ASO3-1]RQD73341.1 MAG: DNA-directed RNA polymerase subunit beta [Desulfonatronospira sp. MSAO_Bac3]